MSRWDDLKRKFPPEPKPPYRRKKKRKRKKIDALDRRAPGHFGAKEGG